MTRTVLAGMIVMLLGACAYLQDVYENNPDYSSGNDPYEKITFAGEIATAAERARCEAAGGEIRIDGMRGWQQCIQTFPDAGKACTDSGQCMGQCRLKLSEAEANTGQPVTGTCQAKDSPFGCYATVENGKVQNTICID